MLNRLIKRLQQLNAKLNNFIKWGLSKSRLVKVIFAISRVEAKIEQVKSEEKPMTKKEITGLEFANKIASLWNETHGSEWHKLACCFVEAKVWDKKEDEIRIYLLNGYLKIAKKENGETTIKFINLKYNLQDQAVGVVKAISSTYKVKELKPTKEACWHDDEGNEVDPDLNPQDAVAFY